MKIRFVKANKALNVSTGAMFLALGILFPLLFHAVNLGSQFSPMHLPVLLAGMICGPLSGLVVGFLTPLLSSLISGMPPIFPMAVAMAFELAVYGFVSGLFMSIFFGGEKQNRQKSRHRAFFGHRNACRALHIRSGHVDSDRDSGRGLHLRRFYRSGSSRFVAGLDFAASCGARNNVRLKKRAYT